MGGFTERLLRSALYGVGLALGLALLVGGLGCGASSSSARSSCAVDAALAPIGGDAPDAGGPIRVLVWNNAVTYGHQSRFTAIPLLQAQGAANGIALDTSYAHVSPVLPEGQVDTCSDPSVFTDAGLDRYDVVLFLNTTGLTLDGDGQGDVHRQALTDFVTTKGRGFVGTHSATDTYDTGWPWYTDFIGANFKGHSVAGTPGTAVSASIQMHDGRK